MRALPLARLEERFAVERFALLRELGVVLRELAAAREPFERFDGRDLLEPLRVEEPLALPRRVFVWAMPAS